MSIKISVIIPVYNVEKYLNQCVDSVLGQSYQNVEVILVDDGSTDESSTICDNYAKMDERIIVIHQKNEGAAVARNTGIKHITGDYVMFLDSDDYWDDSEALACLVKRIKHTNPDVLNFSYKKCYENSKKKILQFLDEPARPIELTEKTDQLDFMTTDFLYIASTWNKVIRSKIIVEHMRFVEKQSAEDIEWCARLLCYANSFDFICENFYCYRQRETSITHNFGEKSCIDLKNNIISCLKIAESAEKDIREYVFRYTAYQLSTFVAVQALATKCPPECIEELQGFSWLLKYHGRNKKVTCLYYIEKIIGFKAMCMLMRACRKLWS